MEAVQEVAREFVKQEGALDDVVARVKWVHGVGGDALLTPDQHTFSCHRCGPSERPLPFGHSGPELTAH